MLNRLRCLPRKTLKAGLTTTLVAIPDGIGAAILAGRDPKGGHYALMVGTLILAMAAAPVPPT